MWGIAVCHILIHTSVLKESVHQETMACKAVSLFTLLLLLSTQTYSKRDHKWPWSSEVFSAFCDACNYTPGIPKCSRLCTFIPKPAEKLASVNLKKSSCVYPDCSGDNCDWSSCVCKHWCSQGAGGAFCDCNSVPPIVNKSEL